MTANNAMHKHKTMALNIAMICTEITLLRLLVRIVSVLQWSMSDCVQGWTANGESERHLQLSDCAIGVV